MPDGPYPRRSPARYLAPLALLATIAGIYLVAHSALGTVTAHRPGSRPHLRSPRRPSHPAPAPAVPTKLRATVRYYVVRPGDGLDVIAARTGVSLATIEALNPGVRSTALHVGQRLIVRR